MLHFVLAVLKVGEQEVEEETIIQKQAKVVISLQHHPTSSTSSSTQQNIPPFQQKQSHPTTVWNNHFKSLQLNQSLFTL